MPRIPIFKLGGSSEELIPPVLSTYAPSLSLGGLQVGVDNLRHDVHLSPKFTETARAHIARLIARHGDVEGLLAAEAPASAPRTPFLNKLTNVLKPGQKVEPTDFKSVLTELHVGALNRAKAENKVTIDLLARLAVIKFLRMELNSQFAQVLERCRMMLKSYEGVRQLKALEYRERVASFQVRKKIIQRKTGQDLFLLLRDIEKETLARMRRSRFGEADSEGHKLLINRLVLSEDGRDDYLCAEQYVMLGNWDRDPDRFTRMREILCEFLRSLEIDVPDRRHRTGSLAQRARKRAGSGRRRHAERIHSRRPFPESAPRGLGAFSRRSVGDGIRHRLLRSRALCSRSTRRASIRSS